tara:strand:- start:2515 stop:3261 length:747 start_codon:yes stop_codon:yes gene_type:complete
MKFIFKNKIIFFLSISLSVIFSQKSIAIVTKKTGNVDYKYYLNKSFSSDINFGSELFNNDLIRTGKDGFVKFSYLDDGTTIKIHNDSELYIRGQINQNSISKRINMTNGLLKLDVSKQNDDEFKVITPTSVASVKGTSFILESDSDGDKFYGFEGIVEVLNKESNQIVKLSKNLKVMSLSDGNINSEIITENDSELLNVFIEYEEEIEEDPAQDIPDNEGSSPSTKELKIKVYSPEGEEKTIIIKYNE